MSTFTDCKTFMSTIAEKLIASRLPSCSGGVSGALPAPTVCGGWCGGQVLFVLAGAWHLSPAVLVSPQQKCSLFHSEWISLFLVCIVYLHEFPSWLSLYKAAV